MKLNFIKNKKSQVWVETVIYTLIGLAIIGILLAVAKPKIDAMKDKATIEQSIEIMDLINEKIQAVRSAPGNRRVVDLKVGKGSFIIDSGKDELIWVIDNSEIEYSEPGNWIPVSGHLKVLTEEANPYTIILNMSYSVNLKYNGEDTGTKEFDSAPVPYSLKIENLGVPEGESNTVIELSEG
jgi:type II secretory pathway pseudopilin PulG